MRKEYDFSDSVKNPYVKHLKKQVTLLLNWMRSFGTALAAVWLGGCGGESGPPLHRVTGTVLYDDQPVEGAVVAFRGDQALQLATGTTDDQGRFTLTTRRPGDGAVAGRHTVTVSKFIVDVGANAGPVSMEEAAENPQVTPESRNELPAKYADPARPLLEFNVAPGERNDFTIRLSH